MSDIFISYSSADRDFVERLSATFAGHGWSVWWDRDIPHGSDFDRVIERELAVARCVVVVWTRASTESRWVRAEAQEALERSILLPVLADETRPPLAFRPIQAASLIGWQGDSHDPRVERVVDSVAGMLGSQAAPSPSRSRRRMLSLTAAIRRRRMWIGATAIAAATCYALFVRPPGDMVLIPAARFQMGNQFEAARRDFDELRNRPDEIRLSEPESPAHDVVVDAFLMDRHEVTAGDYRRAVTDDEEVVPGDDAHPVVAVGWENARNYCQKRGKSLPTETQWESAARGGDGRRFPWGDSPPDGRHANFCDRNCEGTLRDELHDDGYPGLAPVGSHPLGQSKDGVHDMSGNASEWVLDWYDPLFYTKPEAKRPNPVNNEEPESKERVARGGSWNSDAYELRGVFRYITSAESSSNVIGFRCVASPDLPTRLSLIVHNLGILR